MFLLCLFFSAQAQEHNLDTLFGQAKSCISKDIAKSFALAQEGYRLSQKQGKKTQELDFGILLAEIFYRKNDFKEAERYITLSEPIALSTQNFMQQAAIANSRGLIHKMQNRPLKAIQCFERAHFLIGKCPLTKGTEISLAALDVNLGNLFTTIKMYGKAEKHCTRAIKAFGALKDTLRVHICYLNFTECLLQRNALDSALTLAISCKSFFNQNAMKSYETYAYLVLAKIERARKNYNKSLEYIKLANPSGGELDINWALQKAFNYLALNQAQETIKLLIPFLNDENTVDIQIELELVLAAAYKQLGQYALADSYQQNAYRLNDSLKTSLTEGLLANAEAAYALTQKDVEIARKAAQMAEQEKNMRYRYWFVAGLLIALLLCVVALVVAYKRWKLASDAYKRILKEKAELEKKTRYLNIQAKNDKLNRSILEQINQEIVQKQEQMMDSIRYAQRIQEAVLPYQDKINSIFGEHFLMYLPRNIVSGDFYWCGEINDKQNSRSAKIIAVGDCTGHGVPGGFLSMLVIAILNDLIKLGKNKNAGYILDKTHKGLREALKQKRKINEDGVDLALCVVEHDNQLASKTLTFGGACRPLYIWQDGTLTEMKGNKKSIGGKQKETVRRFDTQTIPLVASRTVLYLTSDGFQDQFNPKREKFGSLRLKKTLEDFAHLDLEVQEANLIQIFKTHKQGMEQQDDVTILGLII